MICLLKARRACQDASFRKVNFSYMPLLFCPVYSTFPSEKFPLDTSKWCFLPTSSFGTSYKGIMRLKIKFLKYSFAAKAVFVLPLLASVTESPPFRPYKFATVERDASTLQKSYDYVIIGGGTSGLTVANRLSEDLSSTSSCLFMVPRQLTFSQKLFLSSNSDTWTTTTQVHSYLPMSLNHFRAISL